MTDGLLIAFGKLERELARQIREAALDHEAFSMSLAVCDLGHCRATCCHDGVFLDAEQEGVIDGLVSGGQLAKYGISGSGWREAKNGRSKTATVPAEAPRLAGAFPAHFPGTRCVFLDEAHRCALQKLSMDEGRHPWWWKPVSCWMHPLLLMRGNGGRPWLTLARPGRDPAAAPGYPGFGSCTPCGMERPDGVPAWQALRVELNLLGRIGGRDLVRELSGDED